MCRVQARDAAYRVGCGRCLNPHSRRVVLEARLILEHVAPNAVPVGTRYVGDATVRLEEFVGHLEYRQNQSRGRSAGPEGDP